MSCDVVASLESCVYMFMHSVVVCKMCPHDCFQSHMVGVKRLCSPPILARKHTSLSLVAELEQLAEALQSAKKEWNDVHCTRCQLLVEQVHATEKHIL